MNPNTLRDNNYVTKVSFPPPSNVGSMVKIDLKAIRKVNRIRIANLGANSFSLSTRPIAFSYYAGIDSNKLSRIFQEFSNIDSIHTAFINDAQPVQYLAFVIDKQAPTNATVISEIEVYAEGYADIGTFVSTVDSIGNSSLNFATVHLDADIPTGTVVSFEMRTGKKKTVDS
ncbi:MAG TPA: hypothetical protein DCQ28_11575, partial [Bacteroidetes bacterium]|nr:hypothetical protein [Bacteroidota bacterium]